MSIEINSQEYWDRRFSTGHWEECFGRNQTTLFASTQIKHLALSRSFSGALLDFGCGLGDAIPIYHQNFPQAKLFGVDHSENAILQCRKMFGDIAQFIQGDVDCVPPVDVIIASNVMEHVKDHFAVLRSLLQRCSELYVFVPFNETPLCKEHINCFDNSTYASFPIMEAKIFNSRGWSQYGLNLLINVYCKNIFRPLMRKTLVKRRKQMMFRIKGSFNNRSPKIL
jgi:SAM-dependent methyltransferase